MKEPRIFDVKIKEYYDKMPSKLTIEDKISRFI